MIKIGEDRIMQMKAGSAWKVFVHGKHVYKFSHKLTLAAVGRNGVRVVNNYPTAQPYILFCLHKTTFSRALGQWVSGYSLNRVCASL